MQLDFFGPGARLHHVGYAVPSIERVAPGLQRFEDPIQRVAVAFLDLNGLPVELVEPLGEDSPVRRLLTQRQNIYHSCFTVPDLEAAIAHAGERGVACIRTPVPAVAFEGRRIAWLLHPAFGLFELLEEQRQPGTPC